MKKNKLLNRARLLRNIFHLSGSMYYDMPVINIKVKKLLILNDQLFQISKAMNIHICVMTEYVLEYTVSNCILKLIWNFTWILTSIQNWFFSSLYGTDYTTICQILKPWVKVGVYSTATLHQGFLSGINTNTLTSSIWHSRKYQNIILTSHSEAQIFKDHKHKFWY